MSKRWISMALALVLLVGLVPAAVPVAAEGAALVVLSAQNLLVDGEPIECEKYNIDNSNYFKLRDLAYLLNGGGSQFSVGWDAESNTVSINTGESYVPNGSELVIGEDMSATAQPTAQTILINGEERSDLSVYNLGGNNFFKLRDLGTALGFDVDYDAETNTAVVNSVTQEVPDTPDDPDIPNESDNPEEPQHRGLSGEQIIETFGEHITVEADAEIPENVLDVLNRYFALRAQSLYEAQPLESVDGIADTVIAMENERRATLPNEQEQLEIKIIDADYHISIDSVDISDGYTLQISEVLFYDYTDAEEASGLSDYAGYSIDHVITVTGDFVLADDAYAKGDLIGNGGIDESGDYDEYDDNPDSSDVPDVFAYIEESSGSVSLPSTALTGTMYAGYNPDKAAEYADRYVWSYNKAYGNFSADGGDCTNFVSQCLTAGGMPQVDGRVKGTDGWFYKSSDNRSGTWTYAPYLRDWLANNRGNLIDNPKASDIHKGDVIFYDWHSTGSWSHATICVGTNSNGIPIVDSHSKNYKHKVWNYGYSDSSYSVVQLSSGTQKKYTLDVNGWLDGSDHGNLENYGLFDIKVGNHVETGVNDFYKEYPVGTKYEIYNIRSQGIHAYHGVHSGSLSGTIGEGNVVVSLNFRTNADLGTNFDAAIYCNASPGLCLFNQDDNNVTFPFEYRRLIPQIWHFEKLEDNYYKITSAWDGKALNVSNGDKNSGANIDVANYRNAAERKWCFHWVNDALVVGSKGSPCVLDAGSSARNAYLWEENLTAAQLFTVEKVQMRTLDVNGLLDGKSVGNITEYGTFDVYINGDLVAQNVSDYYKSWPSGTNYEIRNIRPNDGHTYLGVQYGTRSGTLDSGNSYVGLMFNTINTSYFETPSPKYFNGHTYYYYTTASTWYVANQVCTEQGGHLVSITSKEENDFVRSLVGNANIWTGGTDADHQGDWRWTSGETFSYKDGWNAGEPNNTPQDNMESEDYLVSQSTGWNDAVPTMQYRFICEVDSDSRPKYKLDLNGWLDGKFATSIMDYGTCDIYIDGVLNRSGVSDYNTAWPAGTKYEIKNIKAKDGYVYNGVHSGSISGVIGADAVTYWGADGNGIVGVQLDFTKNSTKPTSGTCGTGLTWTIANGILTISGTGNMTNYQAGTSPWYNRTDVKTIQIENGVTSIGSKAFWGCGVTSVTIPASVTNIGDYAFRACQSLTEVTIPYGITSIQPHTFDGCGKLTKATIPGTVTSIGISAFYSTKLANVIFQGTAEQLNRITVANYNDPFKNATVTYVTV